MPLPRLDQSQLKEMDSHIAELLDSISLKHGELVEAVAVEALPAAVAVTLYLMVAVAELRYCLNQVLRS